MAIIKLVNGLVCGLLWSVVFQSILKISRIIIHKIWDLLLVVIFRIGLIRIQNTGGSRYCLPRSLGFVFGFTCVMHFGWLVDFTGRCGLLGAFGVLFQFHGWISDSICGRSRRNAAWLHRLTRNCSSHPVLLNPQEAGRITRLELRWYWHSIRIATMPRRFLEIASLTRLSPRLERLRLLLPKLLVMVIHNGNKNVETNIGMVQNSFVL